MDMPKTATQVMLWSICIFGVFLNTSLEPYLYYAKVICLSFRIC